MQLDEFEDRVNELCVNIEHGTLPSGIIEERRRNQHAEIPHLTLNACEGAVNKISSAQLGQIIAKVDEFIPKAKLIQRAAEGVGGLVTMYSTVGRMLQNERLAAIQNHMNYLSQKHAATDGESTRKILAKVAFYEYILTGEGDVESLPKSFGWFHKKNPQAAEGFASALGKGIRGTFIDDLYGYYARINGPIAKAVGEIDRQKMRDAQSYRLAFDQNRTVKEMIYPELKLKMASKARAPKKTAASILYEKLYVIIENFNSSFAERIASGEFEELGIIMNADECKDRFDQSIGDIARKLGSDREHHFSNYTFDDANFLEVQNIFLNEILRKTTPNAITVGQIYIMELFERIKEELS